MMIFAICIILLSMGILLLKAISGPTAYDRVLSANSFSTNILVLVVLIAFINDEMMLLDIALLYASINFIATVAFSRFFNRFN